MRWQYAVASREPVTDRGRSVQIQALRRKNAPSGDLPRILARARLSVTRPLARPRSGPPLADFPSGRATSRDADEYVWSVIVLDQPPRPARRAPPALAMDSSVQPLSSRCRVVKRASPAEADSGARPKNVMRPGRSPQSTCASLRIVTAERLSHRTASTGTDGFGAYLDYGRLYQLVTADLDFPEIARTDAGFRGDQRIRPCRSRRDTPFGASRLMGRPAWKPQWR